MEDFDGLPGIEEYLAARANNQPIEISEILHISEEISAYTGLPKEQAERILVLFFQEIRSAMLNQEFVDLPGVGGFFISSPKTTNNANKIFPKFQSTKSFRSKLTDEFLRKK